MRATLGLLLLALVGCGSNGGGGGGADANVTVVDTTATPTPHGRWIVYDINATSLGTTSAVIRLHEGQAVPISAVPDAGFHAVWTGTAHDGATGNSNTFTAHDGATVSVAFSL